MLGGSKEVIFQSKVNPYAQCGKMVMENLVLEKMRSGTKFQ